MRFVWLIALVALTPAIERRVGLVTWGTTVILGALSLVFVVAEPFADLLCIRWRLRKDGNEATTHYWTASVQVYTGDEKLVADKVFITEATVSTKRRNTPLHGIAFDFSGNPHPRLERLQALNTAVS